MARAPYNVLVYLYRRTDDGSFEYALLRRADAGFWQGVSGGGEQGETPLEAARREAYEETGLSPDAPILQLDTVEPLPVTTFTGSFSWPKDLYIVPQYCFGMQVEERAIVLSHEHTAYRWLRYEDAVRLLKYDSNRTALWELNQRLKGCGPRG